MQRWLAGLAGSLAVGCSAWASGWESREVTTFTGSCDASAMVFLGKDLVAVGDDEDNVLRVYSLQHPGMPLTTLNVSRFLGFKSGKGEADIEAAAALGDRIYWITSHGRNAAGEEQPRRQRFFATTIVGSSGRVGLEPVGIPYAGLLHDLAADPRLTRYRLPIAALLAPKAPGGLNIEGLVATPDGRLLIGFRNPVPEGRALVVPLLNPAEIVTGRRARFGEPIELNLGGRGIREMCRWRDRFLILAGATGNENNSRLYEWSGTGAAPQLVTDVGFHGLNPEALAPLGADPDASLVLLSDDGTVLCDGIECKKQKHPERKKFRAVLLAPPR